VSAQNNFTQVWKLHHRRTSYFPAISHNNVAVMQSWYITRKISDDGIFRTRPSKP